MQNYNGNPAAITARPANVTISNPEDGIDDLVAATNNAGVQVLTDHVKWLHDKVGLLATASSWTALQTFATAKVTTAPAAADDVVRKTELDAEATARTTADTTEAAARAAADTAESAARTSADNALDARLDVLEPKAAVGQQLAFGAAGPTPISDDRYLYVGGAQAAGSLGAGSWSKWVAPAAGTIKNLRVRCQTAPLGAGANIWAHWSGGSVSMVAAIAAGATSGEDLDVNHAFAVAAGDTIWFRCAMGGGSTAIEDVMAFVQYVPS